MRRPLGQTPPILAHSASSPALAESAEHGELWGAAPMAPARRRSDRIDGVGTWKTTVGSYGRGNSRGWRQSLFRMSERDDGVGHRPCGRGFDSNSALVSEGDAISVTAP